MSQGLPRLWFCGMHLCMCEVVLSWTIFEDIAVSINPCSQVSVYFMSVSIWQWRWLPYLNIILLYCVLAKLKVQHFLLIHHSVWVKSDRCFILSHPLHIPRLGSKNPLEKWKFANSWSPPNSVLLFFFKCFPFLCKNIMMGSCVLFLFTPLSPPSSLNIMRYGLKACSGCRTVLMLLSFDGFMYFYYWVNFAYLWNHEVWSHKEQGWLYCYQMHLINVVICHCVS